MCFFVALSVVLDKKYTSVRKAVFEICSSGDNLLSTSSYMINKINTIKLFSTTQ
jgi:hypothetical protein